jgi:hypothetical protein
MNTLPPDESKTKAKGKVVPLKAHVPSVKSPKPPGPRRPRDYALFDEFVENADRMASGYKCVCEVAEKIDSHLREVRRIMEMEYDPRMYHLREMGSVEPLLSRARGLIGSKDYYVKLWKQFREHVAVFEDENRFYDKKGDWKLVLKLHVVAEQVALLIGSFPNANPHSPELTR